MEGFEGFNPEIARANLNNFSEEVTKIFNYGKEKIATYNEKLVENWYSPKAKECNDIMSKPCIIGGILSEMHDIIISKAVEACKIIANKNGDSFEYTTNKLINGTDGTGDYPWTPLKESGEHGVGMNKPIVKLIMNDLEYDSNKIISELNELPLDLAAYDPNGEILSTYQNTIKTYSNKIMETIKTVTNEVANCYETELYNIQMGTKSATAELK